MKHSLDRALPSPRVRFRPWQAYLLGLAIVAVVALVREPLDSNLRPTPFLLYSVPIVVAAWAGGGGPGLVTTIVSALMINFNLPEPVEQVSSQELYAPPMAVFLLEGVVISALGHGRRRALDSLQDSLDTLESRVVERTAELRAARDRLQAEVAERERAVGDLEELARKLEVSNRELQDFASVASHDLQEPLRKIQAFGDRLSGRYAETLGEQGLDYLARMQNAARRMQALINDLLAFSRVTSKAQPFRPVDLNETVREVISDLEATLEASDGRVDVGSLPVVEADPLQMRQLVQNLVSNALKFSRPGEAPQVAVTAEAGADLDGQAVRLLFEDNGIGFEEKYLDRIFTVFQRLHGRGVYEGTGIGLAVCRKIVERHGGSITARSRPGEGSTFVVTLPTRQGAAQTTEREVGHGRPA